MTPYRLRWYLQLCLLVAAGFSFVPCVKAEQPRRPNIIFVLADDLGWSELGCYGSDFHETPHLDRLAKEGMRFTNAYAAAPVCSPYRAALLTGQHPARVGILDYLRPNSSNALPADSNEFSDTLDIGIIAHYSDDAGSTHKHTGIIRDASNSQWYLFNGLVQDGLDNASPDVEVNIGSTGWELSTLNAGRYIGIYDGFDSDLATKTTDDLTEGTRLYYTTTRADSDFDVRLAIKTTDDLTEGDNLYYTLTRDDSAFDVRLATKTTDDLTEGDNLYYTLTRDDSAFDVRLTTKTTDDLTEGDNLYYLTSRFDSDLSNRTTDDLTEGDNLYYTLTRDDSAFDVRLATKTTDDLSEGDNLYYLTSRFDSDLITGLATKTTDDLTEGANRLYFTDARANAAAVLLIDSNYVSSRIDTGVTVFKAIVEIVSVQNGNTFELNASYGSVCYVPTITGAATVSIINVPTQLNVSQTFSFIIDNGLPAFLPTQLYINNVATSVRWLGGDVPTPTTNGTDVISYIIISGDTTPFSRVLANHAPYLD